MNSLQIPVSGSLAEQLGIEKIIAEAQELHKLCQVEDYHSFGVFVDFNAFRDTVGAPKYHLCCSAVTTEITALEQELITRCYQKKNVHADQEGDNWHDFQKENILLSLQQKK